MNRIAIPHDRTNAPRFVVRAVPDLPAHLGTLAETALDEALRALVAYAEGLAAPPPGIFALLLKLGETADELRPWLRGWESAPPCPN